MRKIIFLAFLFLSCSRSSQKVTLKPTESWLGVYLAQEKIGYSVIKSQIIPQGYQFISRTKMRLVMMEQVSEIISNLTCVTDSELVLRSFDMDFVSKGRSFRAFGERVDSKLKIIVQSGGETKTNWLEVPKRVYPASAIGNLVASVGLIPNKTYDFKVFEPTTMTVVDAKVTIHSKEPIEIKNQKSDAWKLTVTMLGLTSTSWIDSTGETIKEESPPGLLMVRETPKEALAKDAEIATLDVLALFAIRVDTAIPDPRKVTYLKVTLKDIDTTNLNLVDETQNLISVNPIELEIKSELPLSKISLPIRAEKEFLMPSVCIQSDNPKIKEKAWAIIKGSQDANTAVDKLVTWVFNNVKKRATASLPSAVDVLANLEGDCNEHSVLFAALARAVGIPTKIVVGLVYLDKAFYYHAWNKVYLGKWISVDPTFGQFPADATHIKLQEGELAEQAKVLKIVGTVKIEVKEFH
ncbi:MAG: transglutaminase-like domain-containing protein [candidate division WOR-3 bacterium]